LHSAPRPPPSPVPVRTACSATAIDVYFCPHGHPAVPSLKFPAFAPPHIEIYRACSHANGAQLGYGDSNSGSFAKTCKAVPLAATAFKGQSGLSTTARKITAVSRAWPSSR
jgi:hypothetical protein